MITPVFAMCKNNTQAFKFMIENSLNNTSYYYLTLSHSLYRKNRNEKKIP